MPRSQGFARGDLDTAFPLDDKFLALRGLVSVERYYAAAGVYFHVAAATWREAERKPALRVCPDAAQPVADLQSVGLLDADGCVQRRAFANTVGRARRSRRAATDRKARNRAGKSRETDSDETGTAGDGRASRAVLSPSVLNGSDSGMGGAGGAPQTPRQIVHHWLSEHGAASPVGWVNTTLNELVKVYGAEPILTLWESAPKDIRTSKQFVQHAERNLSPGVHANGTKPKGLGPTAEEAESAFNR